MRRYVAIAVLGAALGVAAMGGAWIAGPPAARGVPLWERGWVALRGGTLIDRELGFRQRERFDCGVAVAAYVLHRFGRPTDHAELTRRLPSHPAGVRFRDLAELLDAFGIEGRLQRFPVRRDPPDWPAPPAVLWLPPGHFVLLEAWDREHVVVFDPALGRVRFPANQFGRRWTGAALCLSPLPGGRT